MLYRKAGCLVVVLVVACSTAFATGAYYPLQDAVREYIDVNVYGRRTGGGALGPYYTIPDELTGHDAANGQLARQPQLQASVSANLRPMNEDDLGELYRRATVYERAYLPRSYYYDGNVGRSDQVPRDASLYASAAYTDSEIYNRGWTIRESSFGYFPLYDVTFVHMNNAGGAPIGIGVQRVFGLGAPVGFTTDTFYLGRSYDAQSPRRYLIGSSMYAGAGLRPSAGYKVQRARSTSSTHYNQDKLLRDRYLPKGYKGGPYSGRLDQ